MSGNGGAIAIAKVIAASPSLVHFRWASVRANVDGGVAIGTAISSIHLPLIQTLDLSDNSFGEVGGLALAKALGNLPHLLDLNISDTGMECSLDDVFEALTGTAPNLRVLKINDNEINDVKALIGCLRSKPLLESLSLEGNEVASVGATKICEVLKASCPLLSYINLSTNEIMGLGGKAVADLLGGRGVEVNLNDNALRASVVELLEERVKLLDMGDNREDDDEEVDEEEDD